MTGTLNPKPAQEHDWNPKPQTRTGAGLEPICGAADGAQPAAAATAVMTCRHQAVAAFRGLSSSGSHWRGGTQMVKQVMLAVADGMWYIGCSRQYLAVRGRQAVAGCSFWPYIICMCARTWSAVLPMYPSAVVPQK